MPDNAPESKPSRNFTKADGITLRDYFEAKLQAERCYFESRLLALEKASDIVSKARTDQIERITVDIADLKRSRDEAAGKASQTSVLISMAFGIAGIVFGIVNLLS